MCFFFFFFFKYKKNLVCLVRGCNHHQRAVYTYGCELYIFVSDLYIYIQVALAWLCDYYINLWIEWVPNMLEHDKTRDLQGTAGTLWLIEWGLSDSLMLLTLIVIWMHSRRFNHAKYFCREREKRLYVFVSFWKRFFKYLLYVSVSIHGL